jgi:hypothetical protein
MIEILVGLFFLKIVCWLHPNTNNEIVGPSILPFEDDDDGPHEQWEDWD